MSNTRVSPDRRPKSASAKKVVARSTVKKVRPAKPTPWGQSVLKKIEEFRLALALEK